MRRAKTSISGLLVPFALRDRDARAICGERLRRLPAVRQRAAEELPRRRVVGVLRHRLREVRRRAAGLPCLQVFVAEGEAQQCAVTASGQHLLETGERRRGWRAHVNCG
jgi:hypothetical protein